MSKASEYAERVKVASSQPKFYICEEMDLYAWADSMGQLYCCGGKTLAPTEALAFAAWIQETFEEPRPQLPVAREWTLRKVMTYGGNMVTPASFSPRIIEGPDLQPGETVRVVEVAE